MTVPRRHVMPIRGRRRFTLVEILVVLVILSLIMAVVGGRVGRMPAGVVAKNATGLVQTAFRDASARARATGTPVRVAIGGEDRVIHLETAPDALPAGPSTVLADAAAATPEAAERNEPGSWFGRPMTYDLPRGVTWQDAAGHDLPPEDGVFLFFPNGEAGGGPAWFSTGKRRFRLEVERLTGRLLITEEKP